MADINPIDLQKALSGAEYPTDKESLVNLAREHGADDSLVKAIADTKDNRFDGPNDVQQAVFSGS